MSATTTNTTPEALEAEIQAAGRDMEREYAHGHRAKARELLETIRTLVAQRSPDAVLRMEIKRGLI
jgi:hypothetical protein